MEPAKGRILVVDDSTNILQATSARLRSEGYDVATTTHSVGDALMLRGVDLVLLDFHMPGHTGQWILASYKKAAATAGAQALFFMFTSDRAEANNAKASGFDGVISSKGNEDALIQQVNGVFRMVRLRKL